jgi:hypothetical protein
MSWSSWTASDAAGQGSFWLKLCQPNCAEGKIGYYPVAVTLSDVQTSSEGPWFRDLFLTFTGTRPPVAVPASYVLSPPQS